MKHIFLLFIIFISYSYLFSQSERNKLISAEKKNFREFTRLEKTTYPGDSTIDVTYYKLVLKIDDVDHLINGNTTVGFRISGQSLSSFFLDLRSTLTVDSVTLKGRRVNFAHSTDSLIITLDRTYNKNEKTSVTVFYRGDPTLSGDRSFVFGSHKNTPIIWNLSEPYGAPEWFPCKDTPGDKADSSDVWVTCNSSLKAGSNGVLQAVINNGDGTTTYKWKNHYPIAQYLISVAISNYAEYKEYFRYSPTDSMLVIHYVYPEVLTDSVKALLDKTLLMLQIFSQRYGPYPFLKEKYGHAQFGWNGGMEHQTLTSLISFQESIVSHELSHQWFGDKVTCRDWQDIWLNEGFATYSEGVYYEGAYGRQRYDSYIVDEMNNAKYAQGTIYVQNISDVNQIFDGTRTYSKGGVVLHMLRGIVGDSTFFRILRAYNSDPALAYGTVVTQDFQRVAETVYGSSLDYFFKEWIYGEKYPIYSFNWSSSNISGDQYNVDLKINQTTNTANPVYFTMPVQLNIKTSAGDTLITVLNNQQNQEFNIVVKGQPTDVVFDPNNWILKNVNNTTGVEPAAEIKTFELSQNYPNPFNPSTIIKYRIPTSALSLYSSEGEGRKQSLVTLKIYDILGEEVAVLVNKEQAPGEYEVKFSPSDIGLSSGIYLYRLEAGGFVQSKKMAFIK